MNRVHERFRSLGTVLVTCIEVDRDEDIGRDITRDSRSVNECDIYIRGPGHAYLMSSGKDALRELGYLKVDYFLECAGRAFSIVVR
jgi:hypothetical protein